jgi:F0F1-type ATP synthase epsilon subunit
MRSFSKFFALTVILGLLSVPISAVANHANHAEDEDQPHMQAALEALEQAKHHLEEAKHDKGGHRVAAIKAVDAAIKHVKAGMESGEKHEGDHDKK